LEKEGHFWKLSRNRRWHKRFFVLPQDPLQLVLFYFEDKPLSSSMMVPRGKKKRKEVLLLTKLFEGCVHFVSAQVTELEVEDRPFCLEVGSAAMERKVCVFDLFICFFSFCCLNKTHNQVLLAFDSKSDQKSWKHAIEARLNSMHMPAQTVLLTSPSSSSLSVLSAVVESSEDIWSACEQVERPHGVVLLELQLLKREAAKFSNVKCIDADSCNVPLRVVVDQVTGCQNKVGGLLFVIVRAFYSGKSIIPEVQTAPSATGSWVHRVELSPMLCSLPCETVLMFSLYETAPSESGKLRKLFMGDEGVTTCLGHGHVTLTDECGFLRTGLQRVGLWPGEGSFTF
jgi:hypothetical protein